MTTPAYRHPGVAQKPANLTACSRCGQPVLDAVVDGLDIQADPWPCTPAAELAARLTGRCVLNAHLHDHGIEMSFRFSHHIRYAEELPVLLQHNCTPPAPIDNAKAERIFAALLHQSGMTGDGECPF